MKKFFTIILCLWTHWADAGTCSDIGYYCPAADRYQRIQYIEMTGTQYLDTGIPINSKYDMEMTWQCTNFINDTWATGLWDGYGGNPMIYLTGMLSSGQDQWFLAAYDLDIDSAIGPTDVTIPFDTNIHTTYCYKDTGIWIDDKSTLKPANYGMNVPSEINFLVGRRNNGFYWSGRVYSFVFKDNNQIMAEFIPVYDTQTTQYGMYNTVSHTFHGNLGSGTFSGEAFPCTNAPEHAHYTGSGTDANCPWECDTGYVRTSLDKCATPCSVLQQLHIGTKTFNMYATRQTHPALVLQHQGQTCYVNTQPGHSLNSANIRLDGDIFHLVN